MWQISSVCGGLLGRRNRARDDPHGTFFESLVGDELLETDVEGVEEALLLFEIAVQLLYLIHVVGKGRRTQGLELLASHGKFFAKGDDPRVIFLETIFQQLVDSAFYFRAFRTQGGNIRALLIIFVRHRLRHFLHSSFFISHHFLLLGDLVPRESRPRLLCSASS